MAFDIKEDQVPAALDLSLIHISLANASTTKVLTCIVALENSPGDDYVQV